MKVYRQSKAYFCILIAADIISLIFVITFFITPFVFLAQLISYMKNTFTINDKGVRLKTGWLTTNEVEIPFNKINSVSVKKGIIGSMLGYGNIHILTGNDTTGEKFVAIENPDAIKAEILKKLK